MIFKIDWFYHLQDALNKQPIYLFNLISVYQKKCRYWTGNVSPKLFIRKQALLISFEHNTYFDVHNITAAYIWEKSCVLAKYH